MLIHERNVDDDIVGAALPGYGMPSAHAQFMMFFAVYTMIFVAKRMRSTRLHERVAAGLSAHMLTMVVSYSR